MSKPLETEINIPRITIDARSALVQLKEEAYKEYSNTLYTLSLIIQNIVNNPNDETKRKLKLANPAIKEKIAKYQFAMQFLCLIGFSNKDELLCMDQRDVHVELLEIAYNLLKEMYCINEDIAQEANPHTQALVTSLKPMPQSKKKLDYDPVEIEKEIKILQKKQHEIEMTQVTDRNIKVLPISYEIQSKSVEESKDDGEDDDGSVGALDLIRKNEGIIKFKSRLKEDLNLLKKRKVYSFITISAKFDSHVLQARFGQYETMSDVYQLIRSSIETQNKFMLVIAPMKEFSESTVILKQLNLAPSATFIVRGEVALSQSTISKYLAKS